MSVHYVLKKNVKYNIIIFISLSPFAVCDVFALSILQVKAGLRTLIPIEQKYIEEEPRVSKQVHQQPTLTLYHTASFLSMSTTALLS